MDRGLMMTRIVSVKLICLINMLLIAPFAMTQEIDFARDVQPILAKRCFACHGPDEAEGGLAFHSAATAMAEADSGDVAITPGDSSASVLIARITSDDPNEQMPPEGDRVTTSEIQTLQKWIDQGAVFTKHWAFEPMQPIAVPPSPNGTHPIDAFLLEKLDSAGLAMNPPADRPTLIRRVTYDLTGLPPTAAEIEAFVNDKDPMAYENLVDRLLQSHHYGERWGRHWLDLVRYGETNSFERDHPKPNVWKYRDYVIRSFNDDKPYDQFIREQLAGDQLEPKTEDSLTATGYYRLGIWDDEPADPLQARFDELDDLITTTGQVFLGLTINCARCHDHKIDPIPQTDYYGMLAFFADVSRYGERHKGTGGSQIDVSAEGLVEQYQKLEQQQKSITEQVTKIEQSGIVKMSAEDQRATEGPPRERNKVLKQKLKQHLTAEEYAQYTELKSSLEKVRVEREQLPPRQSVLGLGELRDVEETFLLFRGNPHSPTDPVTPRFPAIYEEPLPEIGKQNRRRLLADWITKDDNRLTSRVLVNRLWQHHFGRGIVRSSNNFGQLGTPPTHPELLDFLAQTFVQDGWRIKSMHRRILTSRAYQMSSQSRDDGRAIDPGNDLFWRFDPRRLSAEEVRDSILTVNQTLNRQPYGPSFFPKLSAEVLAGQSRPGEGWGNSADTDRARRSVYIHVKRSLLTPMLSAFDFPEPDVTCEARFATLQPNQAMALLNSDFIHEEASRLAKLVQDRLSDSQRNDPEALMGGLVKQVLGREATDDERADATALMSDLREKYNVSPERAVTLLALSILNWNEFVFVF